MKAVAALAFAALLTACSGTGQSIAEANPGPARAIAVDGLVNVELFCDLGAIGGTVGPSAPTSREAAEALAQQRNWSYASIEEQVNSDGRSLFLFSNADGSPTAEVVVGRSDEQPGADLVDDDEGWRVWGLQSCQ